MMNAAVRWITLAVLPLVSLSAHAASDLDRKEDFGKISEHGFESVVDGSYPALSNSSTASNDQLNGYPWSTLWHNGDLYVTTLRGPLCWFGILDGYGCFGGDVTQLDENYKAETWRYTHERITQCPWISS